MTMAAIRRTPRAPWTVRASATPSPSPSSRSGFDGSSIPPFLNTTPHPRHVRQHFYADVRHATLKAIEDGAMRAVVRSVFPELNTETDVYRVGTLLEMARDLTTAIAQDGKRVKLCVQQSLGKGVFQGLPLSLSGVRRIMEKMEWEEGLVEDGFVRFGSVGEDQVEDDDDVFVILCPQNMQGAALLPLLQAMDKEAGQRPIVLINPELTDIPSSGNVMQVRGRQERMDFVANFKDIYHFRLLYKKPFLYPIYGALRMTYGEPWTVYKRVQKSRKEEDYFPVGSFDKEPTTSEITSCILGR